MHILVINKERFDAMDPELRDILIECAQEALNWQRDNAEVVAAESEQAMKDYGIEIYDPTPEEFQAFKDLTKPVWGQFVGDRIPEKAVQLIQETQSDDYVMQGKEEK